MGMSKETDQARVMLYTVYGCLETMRKTNSFARLDIRQAVTDGIAACHNAIRCWPGFYNRAWISLKMEAFKKYIMETDDRGYSTCTMAAMCERLIYDLLERVAVGKKREMLEPVAQNLKVIHDFCDPQGLNYPAYEKSDFLLDELYRDIDWK